MEQIRKTWQGKFGDIDPQYAANMDYLDKMDQSNILEPDENCDIIIENPVRKDTALMDCNVRYVDVKGNVCLIEIVDMNRAGEWNTNVLLNAIKRTIADIDDDDRYLFVEEGPDFR